MARNAIRNTPDIWPLEWEKRRIDTRLAAGKISPRLARDLKLVLSLYRKFYVLRTLCRFAKRKCFGPSSPAQPRISPLREGNAMSEGIADAPVNPMNQ